MKKAVLKKIASAAAISVLAAALCSCGSSEQSDPTVTQNTVEGVISETSAVTEKNETSDDTNEENTDEKASAELSLSQPSGFYDSEFELTITCSEPDAVIYYTTDGNMPTTASEKYTAPIPVTDRSKDANLLSEITGISASGNYVPRGRVKKCNVIRAIAVMPDGSQTECINGSYFIGYDREEYANVPFVSLMINTTDLFNKETGIYVLGKTYDDFVAEHSGQGFEAWEAKGNYSNSGMDWERPAVFTMIDPDGNVAVSQDLGVRIMGAASRNDAQKSLKFTARDIYGKKNVKYELIPDNTRSDGNGNVEKYKSFVLRNGGNDNSFGKIRDPYLQSLVKDRSFDTLQSTPVVAFLDGEYWGCYTLTEDYSDNYFENNYGIDNKNIILLKRGEIEDGNEEDIELYNTMYDYIIENDMSVPENYEKACELLDMQSFADYCAFNLYIFNQDGIFENNNWRMWRTRDTDPENGYADGKWRMAVFDTDYSSGIYDGGANFKKNNLRNAVSGRVSFNVKGDENDRPPAVLFAKLLENSDFRAMTVNTMCDIRNVNFCGSDAIEKLMAMYDVYSKLEPATFDRFGPDWVAWQNTTEYFDQKITELAKFIDGRYDAFPNIVADAFELSDPFELTIHTGDKTVDVNTVSVSGDFKTKYFGEFEITLNAPSGNFSHWEYSGCEISDANSPTAAVRLTDNAEITAVYN